MDILDNRNNTSLNCYGLLQCVGILKPRHSLNGISYRKSKNKNKKTKKTKAVFCLSI